MFSNVPVLGLRNILCVRGSYRLTQSRPAIRSGIRRTRYTPLKTQLWSITRLRVGIVRDRRWFVISPHYSIKPRCQFCYCELYYHECGSVCMSSITKLFNEQLINFKKTILYYLLDLHSPLTKGPIQFSHLPLYL